MNHRAYKVISAIAFLACISTLARAQENFPGRLDLAHQLAKKIALGVSPDYFDTRGNPVSDLGGFGKLILFRLAKELTGSTRADTPTFLVETPLIIDGNRVDAYADLNSKTLLIRFDQARCWNKSTEELAAIFIEEALRYSDNQIKNQRPPMSDGELYQLREALIRSYGQIAYGTGGKEGSGSDSLRTRLELSLTQARKIVSGLKLETLSRSYGTELPSDTQKLLESNWIKYKKVLNDVRIEIPENRDVYWIDPAGVIRQVQYAPALGEINPTIYFDRSIAPHLRDDLMLKAIFEMTGFLTGMGTDQWEQIREISASLVQSKEGTVAQKLFDDTSVPAAPSRNNIERYTNPPELRPHLPTAIVWQSANGTNVPDTVSFRQLPYDLNQRPVRFGWRDYSSISGAFNEITSVAAGIYTIANGAPFFVTVKPGETLAISTQNFIIPKKGETYKGARIFVDTTVPAVQELFALREWTSSGLNEFMWQIACIRKSAQEVRQQDLGDYCAAWNSGDFRKLIGPVLYFDRQGNWGSRNTHYAMDQVWRGLSKSYDRLSGATEKERPAAAAVEVPRKYYNHGRAYLSDEIYLQGETVNLLPGYYGLEYLRNDDSIEIQTGIQILAESERK